MNLLKVFNRKKSSNHIAWKVAGGVALAAVAAGLVAAFPDIKRYLRP